MTNNIVRLPSSYYGDPNQSRPIFNGSVYIGMPDTDPEVEVNRLPVTLKQEDGTLVPIAISAQPLVTGSGGYITYDSGSPEVLVDGNYSIKVLDSQGNQEYYFQNVLDGVPATDDSLSFVKPFKTLAEAVASTGLVWDVAENKGDALNIAERTTGNGGGAMWDVVLSSTVTENTFNIVQCTGVPALSLELRLQAINDIRAFGATGDGTTDDQAAIQAAIDTGKEVLIPVGDFLIGSALTNFTTMKGTNFFDSRIIVGASFVGTVALAVNIFYTRFANFQVSMNNAPSNDITGIEIVNAREARINSVRVTGNSVDGTGISFDQGGGLFTGFHDVVGCYITSCKIGAHFKSVVTASRIRGCDFVGKQTPLVSGSVGIKCDPSSGSGCSIVDNEIEGFEKGVYSEGTYLKIAFNRFETCDFHIEAVRGAGNARCWIQITNNTHSGLGVPRTFPRNATDLVLCKEIGETFDTSSVEQIVGNGVQYVGSASGVTQTYYGSVSATAAAGYFIRVGTITLAAQFRQATIQGHVQTFRTGVSNAGGLNFALNLFQSAALGTDPGGSITQWGDRDTGGEISAVVTVADGTNSIIEIWIENLEANAQMVYDITSVSSLSVYVPDNTGTNQAALPAGTVIGTKALTVFNNLKIDSIPTSSAGLSDGTVWSNSGVLTIV